MSEFDEIEKTMLFVFKKAPHLRRIRISKGFLFDNIRVAILEKDFEGLCYKKDIIKAIKLGLIIETKLQDKTGAYMNVYVHQKLRVKQYTKFKQFIAFILCLKYDII
jgi:hypothetical protein